MAQSFYIRLLTLVDDFGRFEAEPILLRSLAFPLREDIRTPQVQQLGDELQANQLAVFYKVDGKSYLQLTNWTERARSDKSKYPEPTQRNPAESCGILPPKPSPSSSPPSSPSAPSALVFPQKFSADEGFMEAWNKWEACRRGLKKPKNWNLMFQEQINWLEEYPVPKAIEIMLASIRNGWQGLFPLKEPVQTSQQSGGNPSAPSVWELKTRLEAKQKRLQQLKNKGHEDPMGTVTYANDTDRAEAKKLREEIKEIERKLAQ